MESDVIRRGLIAIHGREPSPSMVSVWHTDLGRKLGRVEDSALQAAFDSAGDEAAARRASGKFGAIGLNDIVHAYRRQPNLTPVEIPTDTLCEYGCRDGHLMMIEPPSKKSGGREYEVQVPCSCQAGEYQRTTSKMYRKARGVDDLLSAGWTLTARPTRATKPEAAWLIARSEGVGPSKAIREFKTATSELPPQPEDAMARAWTILSQETTT